MGLCLFVVLSRWGCCGFGYLAALLCFLWVGIIQVSCAAWCLGLFGSWWFCGFSGVAWVVWWLVCNFVVGGLVVLNGCLLVAIDGFVSFAMV